MSGTKKGQRSTGGSRPRHRPIREEETAWKDLLAEKKAPADGRGTPMNIIRHPLELPPMEPIKGRGGG
jgi:hypothetical protein